MRKDRQPVLKNIVLSLEVKAPQFALDLTKQDMEKLQHMWCERNPGTELVFKPAHSISPWFSGYIDWR